MKLFVFLFFTLALTLGGTTADNKPVYGNHAIDPKVYYNNIDTYELVEELPNKTDRELVHQFFKNDHVENVKLDAKKDIQKIFLQQN